MADNKQGRDEQVNNEERRQQERMQEEALDRADENEPVRGNPDERLGDLNNALETHNYPTTTDELVDAYGNYEVKTQNGQKSLEEVFSSSDTKTYDSADDVRSEILKLTPR
ncbi:DUF5789 family protein [Haloferax denitrificans]|uniref:DUF5789 family protein n=1 Tax=Haloferax denitrificans TaxID=35745 RepID=UPI000A013628|nr:hypothetical protein [Haloferax denitrificans]